MLVYKKEDIPEDPVFPADLKELGFFINDKDQIRQIADPNEGFRYRINHNERWNEVHCNAFNECIRDIVISRLTDLGMSTLCLPLGAQPHEKHVPILTSSNLASASRVIVILGSPDQAFGVWTYRSIGEQSINTGSMVNIVKAILNKKDEDIKEKKEETEEQKEQDSDIAVVIANTGQLVYHHGSGRAMSQNAWQALPAETAAHPAMKQTHRNVIPRNANWREHIKCIFEDVLAPGNKVVNPKAKIDIIGVEEGGLGAVEYLLENWQTWNQSISGICFTRPLHQKQLLQAEEQAQQQQEESSNDDSGVDMSLRPGSFSRFLATKCRAYLLSDKPLEWPVPGTLEYGCNTYSSGEELNHEDSIVSAWQNMLSWFDKLHRDPSYEEVEFIIEYKVDDEGWGKWQRGEEDAIVDMRTVATEATEAQQS